MKKRWIGAIAATLLLSIVILAFIGYASRPDLPSLSRELKDRIAYDYYAYMSYNPAKAVNCEWYDENGGEERNRVFRYIGTYGECIAVLVYGDNQTDALTPMELPCLVDDMPRDVYFHTEIHVYVYHKTQTIYEEEWNDYPNLSRLKNCHVAPIYGIIERGWLSDAQLEELTQDIEKMAVPPA